MANPFGRPGTGWVLRVNPAAADVVIPYGGGACASLLNDAFQLAYMASPANVGRIWERYAGSTNVSTGADAGAAFAWAGIAFYAGMSSMATHERVSNQEISSEYFRPLPCAAAAAGRGRWSPLVYEEEVARLLAVQRNQLAGRLDRQRGIYDVLTVMRASSGLALDAAGLVVAAQDRVSKASGWGDHLPIVMYTGRDGLPRPVLSGEAALLSLGRGVMANPSWLGASFPAGLAARVRFDVSRHGSLVTQKSWSLRHGTAPTNSSRWLQEVANVLCTPPSTSFVVDGSFCAGAEKWKQSGQAPLLAGGRPVPASLGFEAGQATGWSEMSLTWHVTFPNKAATAPTCPPLNGLTFRNTLSEQPLWLLGRGDRELHATGPTGGAEVDLARHLSSCGYSSLRWDLSGFRPIFDDSALTARLSQRYRRDIFQVDPPDEPTSNTALFLALLVLVPEVVAIVLLLLQRPLSRQQQQRRFRWPWREGLSLLLVVAAGGVALVGVGYLYRQEHVGHTWRAAAVRHGRRMTANETESIALGPRNVDYRGRLTRDNETLILVARTGFRHHLLRTLLVVSVAVYGALTVAVLVRRAVAVWRLRSAADGVVERGGVGAKRAPAPPPQEAAAVAGTGGRAAGGG